MTPSQNGLSRDVRDRTPSNCEATVLPAKNDSDFMFCLQSYQGLIIDIPLVYYMKSYPAG